MQQVGVPNFLVVALDAATASFLQRRQVAHYLRELRSRLLTYGLDTTGLKSELRARLEKALLDDRQQFKSWDPALFLNNCVYIVKNGLEPPQTTQSLFWAWLGPGREINDFGEGGGPGRTL